MRVLKKLLARLDNPRAGRVVIGIALLLALPSIFSPYFVDEHLQTSKWKAWHQGTSPSSRHILNDYFVFIGPEGRQQEMESLGVWWMAPDLKIAFWRPLAAATHVLDHYLWPGHVALIHLHTLLWLAALLTALGALLRRFLPLKVANLALALYAWDDARGMALSWIANRHALVATCFGLCALIAHDRWRRERWRPGAYLAPALFALGLLSSEMALATAAFLFAHALWIDQGPWRRRLARLLPFVLVVAAWQTAYVAGDFGVAASGAYQNPVTEPLAFAAKVLERGPIYALGQLTPIDSMLWGLCPTGARVAIYLLALAVLVIVGRVAWPRLAGQAQGRFWLTGAGLSLTFICASAPWDRQLVFVGVGAAPALAMVLAAFADAPAGKRWPRLVVQALVICNLVLAPLMLPVKSLTILGLSAAIPSPDASIPRDAPVTHKTLVIPWLAFEAPLWFTWAIRDAQGIPRPTKTRILAVSFADVTIARLDAVTLRLHLQDGFFASDSSKVFRSPTRPFHRGDSVKMSNVVATVLEVTKDGRPRTVEFRFASPLEAPEWLWMRGTPGGLASWTPPHVGETVVVGAAP